MTRNDINRAILFDFDGTLLDSFATHYGAYERMFAHFGIAIDRDRFAEAYSPDWYVTFRAFGLPAEQWKDADALWLREAARHDAPLRDACISVVTSLWPQWRLGVVTFGSHRRVMADLQRTNLAAHMEVVVSGEDVQSRKPSPEGILQALEKLGVSPSRAVYVGDTPIDSDTARAANVRFVGIQSDFCKLEAETMVTALSDLPRVLPANW